MQSDINSLAVPQNLFMSSSLFPLARSFSSTFFTKYGRTQQKLLRKLTLTMALKSATTTSNKRSHMGVQADSNHGLWAFFRKKEADDVVKYETLVVRQSLTEFYR